MSGIKITPDSTGVDVSTDTISGGVADGDDVQRVKVGYGVNGEYADLEEKPATENTLLVAEGRLLDIVNAVANTDANMADVATRMSLFMANTDGSSVYATPAPFAVRVDEASPTVTYAGFAAVGTATADPLWRIKKITDSSGDVTVEWADGDANFNNIWDNRASLTYL